MTQVACGILIESTDIQQRCKLRAKKFVQVDNWATNKPRENCIAKNKIESSKNLKAEGHLPIRFNEAGLHKYLQNLNRLGKLNGIQASLETMLPRAFQILTSCICSWRGRVSIWFRTPATLSTNHECVQDTVLLLTALLGHSASHMYPGCWCCTISRM